MKKLILILCMIGISACSPKVDNQVTVIDTPAFTPNLPRSTDLTENITFKIYKTEDMKTLPDNEVLFTLTKEEYENLNYNILDLQRYILQLKETVIYYRNQTASGELSTSKK